MLGEFESPGLYDREFVLSPGDVLLLYTDGVTEARRAGDFFGEQRLESLAEKHIGYAKELMNSILAEVVGFQAGLPRDDIVIVTVGVDI